MWQNHISQTAGLPRQYLLTGSANIQSLPGVQESLAGRVRKLRLRPLSQGELLGVKPTFLERAFRLDFPKTSNQVYDRQAILQMSFRGGFPETVMLSERERKKWHQDYVDALIERDLQDIARIHRQDAMHELLKVLASWSSKYMDIAAIGSGLSIHRPTVESYINALEALYIVERVSPWIQTDYERVGKRPKLFITDSGLMSSVLGWQRTQVQDDCDRSGRELLGIEVKAGSAINSSHFKHLRWFKENIAKDRPFVGIVLYSGNLAGSMGDGLWAVPFSALWSK